MNSRLLSVSALVGLALSAALVSPAHAVAFDASGVDFNFANPGNADLMTGAKVGDQYVYSGVATIDGTSIDAVVTVDAVSPALVSTYEYSHVNDVRADILNGMNDPSEADLTPGCYTNGSFVLDPDNYPVADFVATDRLNDGRITKVDADQGSDSDVGIHNEVDICTWYDAPSAPSSMVITIEFLVGGLPVTLDNIVLNVQDIDGGQSVGFSSPKPSSYELTSGSMLDVTGDETFTKFYGEESSDDDPDYAADVRYDSVSSLTYRFGFSEGSGGGSLDVIFESFVGNLAASESLANTGTSDNAPGIVFFAGLVFVLTGVITARRLTRA